MSPLVKKLDIKRKHEEQGADHTEESKRRKIMFDAHGADQGKEEAEAGLTLVRSSRKHQEGKKKQGENKKREGKLAMKGFGGCPQTAPQNQ